MIDASGLQPIGDGTYRVSGFRRSALTGRHVPNRESMSEVAEASSTHRGPTAAVKTDLQRRRELAAMTKPTLIDYIIRVENSLAALTERIDHAYSTDP